MPDPRPVYAVLCVVGALLPLSQFAPWAAVHGLSLPLLIGEAFRTPVSAFAWFDVLVSAVVLVVFMAAESRRLGFAGWWWAVLALCLVGVSLALPLFLYMREGRLAPPRTPFDT